MKNYYDFSKMKRVPHPLQNKIDKGEIKLKSHFDIPDTEFDEKIQHLSEDDREYIIKMRQEWKEERLLQEISLLEESCNNQIPSDYRKIFEMIKNLLPSNGQKTKSIN